MKLAVAEKLGGAPHSKLALRLWLRLLTCSMAIEKRIRVRLTDAFDTTLPRFDVLSALDRAHDGLTMGQLSSALLVSNGNITGIVTRLIDDGLVVREADPNDRRTLHVRLTDKGRAEFEAMAHAHEAWLDQLMADLGSEEMETLLTLLDRVRNSIGESRL